MPLSHAYDVQDENIDVSDKEPNKGDDSKEISAVRIGNGTEGCLVSMVIPPDDDEGEVENGTPNKDGKGLLERQGDNNLENGETVLKRVLIQWDKFRHE